MGEVWVITLPKPSLQSIRKISWMVQDFTCIRVGGNKWAFAVAKDIFKSSIGQMGDIDDHT